MNIKEALQSLGVKDDTLSGEEKRRLDEDGYLILSNMLSDTQLHALAGSHGAHARTGTEIDFA